MNVCQRFCKRSFDIVASFAGLAVLFIPFLAVALLVRCTSAGPVFFRQARVGRKGRPFTVVKFRTMYTGSEKSGPITTAADSRITSVGRFLRRYKLDEFPQLWNVFIGKMSFVGPRPDVPGYADRIEGEYRRVLELRPGITGPATLFFRDEEELLATVGNPKEYNDRVIWPRKMEMNLAYLKRWSFFKDIGFILITLFPGLDKVLRLVPESCTERGDQSETLKT